MGESENTQEVTKEDLDLSAIIASAAESASDLAAEKARKAFESALADAPATNAGKAGVLVTGSEEERALEGNPYKSVGEFLIDVKNAGMGEQWDPRLHPLKVKDDKGFSMTKAMGQKFMGSMYQASHLNHLKQTGLNEGIGSQGGFLVDTDRAAGLMARAYDVGELLQRVFMTRVGANSNGMTFRGENETSRADGSRRGGVRGYWLAEGGTKTASKPDFREIELKLKKVAALVYATDELLDDAAALESYIMRVFPEELRFMVEDAIINGTGVGMPLGIMADPALVTVPKEGGQAATTLVSQNIINMWARMWGRSRRNAIWLINQDVEPQMHQFSLAVGTGGQVVYLPPGGLSASPYGTLYGRPVIPVEYCATLGTAGDIMLVDLNEYYMIEKGGIESASSIHVNFVYDETVFRFVYRVDGQGSWNSALTPNSGSTNTLSPFVVLATRA
jgi:HK97 family phage major capsid protein